MCVLLFIVVLRGRPFIAHIQIYGLLRWDRRFRGSVIYIVLCRSYIMNLRAYSFADSRTNLTGGSSGFIALARGTRSDPPKIFGATVGPWPLFFAPSTSPPLIARAVVCPPRRCRARITTVSGPNVFRGRKHTSFRENGAVFAQNAIFLNKILDQMWLLKPVS